jgi:hypothetical protein
MVTSGSSRATKSLTELLAGKPLSAVAFNKILEALGYLETLTRNSTKGATKSYKSVTEKGLPFGKNVTSPQNPRETQPHWFVDSFEELYSSML